MSAKQNRVISTLTALEIINLFSGFITIQETNLLSFSDGERVLKRLRRAGYVSKHRDGTLHITDSGKKYIAANPIEKNLLGQ